MALVEMADYGTNMNRWKNWKQLNKTNKNSLINIKNDWIDQEQHIEKLHEMADKCEWPTKIRNEWKNQKIAEQKTRWLALVEISNYGMAEQT